ncbi:zinc-dependent alcohol dehydrogenase family protein [Paraburkholderia caballeronis]|uniref:zinc-dependent alcohol dehydrogenase family protein n=1 Tax=Paraburkholderia caballeronis TaxID=416943 RepID=UPI001065B6CE|nr:NAD(P)-dependent alcohol dehydrogenase [Paraburkholderia caballeronis]TDV20857.1 NADPH:quinone reductase-like Zn-dependent oxidoreductase [Paraburkholderia caballeronis]TDV21286.1 NADPH:quinone reductase-like Zn-dependent oxidoreductase [Paraburkholderia caballeronis]TDV33325.1 NADPH:quinone reductase-like Zn-dependent oxidoreductase [Paraburkholderia caballeronis]
MKAWLLKDFGLHNLQPGDVTTPAPQPGELLVKVGAVSLNFRDKAIVDGIYEPHLVPKPLIPVSDAAGTVVAVGAGVTRFQVGDRVNSTLYSRWIDGAPGPDEPAYCIGMPLPGGLAEYMILHEDSAVPAPASMSDEEASTLPIAALTAWYSLMDVGHLEPGQTVLVQGTGGVSVFAAQIAAAHGARVIVTSSKDENLAKIKTLVGDAKVEGVNYRTHPDWERNVLELTNGLGADVTIDVAGGDGINRSVAATKVQGVVAQVGFLSGQTTALNLMPVIFRQTTIRGIAVAPRSSFERLNVFLDAHRIKPVIERVYRFDDAVQAFEHLARGPFGKVVIKIADA